MSRGAPLGAGTRTPEKKKWLSFGKPRGSAVEQQQQRLVEQQGTRGGAPSRTRAPESDLTSRMRDKHAAREPNPRTPPPLPSSTRALKLRPSSGRYSRTGDGAAASGGLYQSEPAEQSSNPFFSR
jgi:hypothetical protein